MRQIHTPLKCGGGLALAIEAVLFNWLTHLPVWSLGPQCPRGHHGHQGDREMRNAACDSHGLPWSQVPGDIAG